MSDPIRSKSWTVKSAQLELSLGELSCAATITSERAVKRRHANVRVLGTVYTLTQARDLHRKLGLAVTFAAHPLEVRNGG